LCACLLVMLVVAPAQAQSMASRPIRISVDATHASSQKILHADLEIPALPGPLTLYYPKWMPADHSPDGPIANLAGLRFAAGGKELPWRRDLVDMYTFHVEVPGGASAVTAHVDFLLSAPGPTIDFAASSSAHLLILMWNEVLLYPAGRPASQIVFQSSLWLPRGWKFNTALPVASQSGDKVDFAPVPLDLLVDSPVQSGEFIRVIPLTKAGQSPPNELDIAADDAWALEISPALIEKYKQLVTQADALYQSQHYRDYHFLLTLSDNVLPLGQEHHESSDDRVSENTLADPNRALLEAGLFPHEYTHSWNGQYRRPAGLTTPDFQQPMKGDLLWVYEGLTTYLGTILTVRSGLWTDEQARDDLAATASMLDHRAGRTWRSLQDTADAAQILYFAPGEWSSYRRGTDFYPESVLLWLEADVIIRRQTQDHKSLDDFCRMFLGGPGHDPVIKTYTFEELVSTLNRVAPYDWSNFFRTRLDSHGPQAPLGGISGGGWQLVYNDQPNVMIAARKQVSGEGDFTSSLGLVVTKEGRVRNAIAGMPAYESGLAPYMQIIGVNGRTFSVANIEQALKDSKSTSNPIIILASNNGSLATYKIEYHDGIRFPHLRLIPGARDYLGEILKPLPERPATAQRHSQNRGFDRLLLGDRGFLIQYGYPASVAQYPRGAFDDGAWREALSTRGPFSRGFINEDDNAGRRHEPAHIAKRVVRNCAFWHGGHVIRLLHDSALKDHHCVGRHETRKTREVPLLRHPPEPLLERDYSLDGGFGMASAQIVESSTVHSSSITHAPGSGSEGRVSIVPGSSLLAAKAQHT
jgi:predicted metalloprotease with PDZ domain